MEYFSAIKECLGKCLDDQKQDINISITIHNDREYFCNSRPKDCRPEFLKEIGRKRAHSVG